MGVDVGYRGPHTQPFPINMKGVSMCIYVVDV